MAEEIKLNKKNFSEWYDKVLAYAQVIDDRFPLKGVYVWMPYGYFALKAMMRKMENLLDATGHKDSYFPMFAPATVFAKEADFLKGFRGETLRVKHVGEHELDEELVVRPTSETIIYPMYSLWIRSWRDLPLKLYQTVPIFRWETKMTKALLRVREIVKFKEAHTAHATAEDAEKQIAEAIEIYKKFFDFLRVPYIILKTPEWETFAGALYNYDFFTIMPDGKALELGSVINLGQKFARAFEIKYKDKNEKDQFVWQTCYGISERSLGAALALHGDDKGLAFISEIAPVQIVVVPILKGEKTDEKVLGAARLLKEKLSEKFRVDIDESDKTPGQKFYHWELKGVPVRVEIGKRDLENKSFVVARRDTGKKENVKEKYLEKFIFKLLPEIDENLFAASKKFFVSMIFSAKSVEEAAKILNSSGGIVKLAWCGKTACGKAMEEKLVGGALGFDEKEKVSRKCANCGGAAKMFLNFGRSY